MQCLSVTRFEVSISRRRDCLSTRNDEVFREVLAVVSDNHIHHIVAGECGGSVKADQVHRDQLWGEVKGHAWAVVYKVIGSVRGLTAVDIRGSAVASVIESVRKVSSPKRRPLGVGASW